MKRILTFLKTQRMSTLLSAAYLLILGLMCLLCGLYLPHDPTYMDLSSCSVPPCNRFLFGTDTLGRDIFSMIFYGGRISLAIGLLSTVISTLAGVLYGTVSGTAPAWLDRLLMRAVELFLSVPSLLLTVFFQAILGEATVLSLSLVIGLTSWTSIAKVVRTEVRRMRNEDYIVAAKYVGTGFFRMLFRHYFPGVLPSILFMIVMNVRGAILAESTLSFMGLGLPLEVISWGSMLTLAQNALLSRSWWIVLIPGLFLVATLLSITALGNAVRRAIDQRQSLL